MQLLCCTCALNSDMESSKQARVLFSAACNLVGVDPPRKSWPVSPVSVRRGTRPLDKLPKARKRHLTNIGRVVFVCLLPGDILSMPPKTLPESIPYPPE